MADVKKYDETAILRHKILAPVIVALEDGTDVAKIAQLKNEIYLVCFIDDATRYVC